VHFAKAEKKERYELLKERLFAKRAEKSHPIEGKIDERLW
jgi:hypothetical protein